MTEEKQDKLMCPMSFNGDAEGWQYCNEEKCAWWYGSSCAIIQAVVQLESIDYKMKQE